MTTIYLFECGNFARGTQGQRAYYDKELAIERLQRHCPLSTWSSTGIFRTPGYLTKDGKRWAYVSKVMLQDGKWNRTGGEPQELKRTK